MFSRQVPTRQTFLEDVFDLESVPDNERGGVVQGEYDDRLGNVWDEISKDTVWLTYPVWTDDVVKITRNDVESIQPGRPLTDNIIDFYMQYLCREARLKAGDGYDVLVDVFNSFFFTQLADIGGSSAEPQQRKEAFERVQKWTREVDIFEKDYVFIPVNQSSHWSLIILCGLGSLTSLPDLYGWNSKHPRILHLNSVESKHRNLEGHIRSYIIHAWKERYRDPNEDQLLALSQLKYEEVKVPQQDNDYDCGIYLLQFVELYRSLIVQKRVQGERFQGDIPTRLWEACDGSAKRREIRNLILELSLRARRKFPEYYREDSPNIDLKQSDVWDEISKDPVWLTYPKNDPDAVEITRSDMESIQPGRPLRNNIIDFYIRSITRRNSWWASDIHVFNSFFFSQLAHIGGSSLKSQQRKEAFERVQKWTREVEIFERHYVFIPVNQSSHWSLIILCGLRSLTRSPAKDGCLPRILHLNSVESTHRNLEGHIRSYIIHAWKERYPNPNVDQQLALSQLKYEEVKVPQQDNDYDCGIYLLQFVDLYLNLIVQKRVQGERFQDDIPSRLWEACDGSAKRREIRNLILELSLRSRRKSRGMKLVRRLGLDAASDGDEERTEGSPNNELKQSNAGVGENNCVDHQTVDEVALDNQPTEIEHVYHQSTGGIVFGDRQQQREQSPCAKLKPVKVRSKRCNWSKAETSVLLDCMKEGPGRFCSRKGKQVATDWIAISKEIEKRIGSMPSGDQCRLRYDTLLKAYKSCKDYCMRTGKQFCEVICPDELKVATNLTMDWYNTIDGICGRLSRKGRSPKRVKCSP